MYVIEVLPLAANAPAGTLSYRSSTKYPIGSIVTVTLRRKQVLGVALSCESIRDVKAALKTAHYTLSGSISKATGRVQEAFMKMVANIAAWHAAAPGAVLATLIGEFAKAESISALGMRKGRGFELIPIEASLHERSTRYRLLIEEAKKHKKSVLFVISTHAEAAFWKKEFSAHQVLVLSGAQTGARRTRIFETLRTAPPTIIISTPAFSFVPISSLGHIILERVGAGGFRLLRRPYLDMRVALIEYARAYALPLALGDFPLPLEYRKGVRKFSGTVRAISVVDTRAPAAKNASHAQQKEPWSAVPDALREPIQSALATGGRVAVLAVRKGYAPVVVCRDCGNSLKDERGKVYTFSQQKEKRILRTNDGKSVLAADTACPVCGSWNLLPLGVGVERVAEELRKLFPDAPLVEFAADSVRTLRAAQKQLEPLATPGSIVVGTEAMVPWLLAAESKPLSLAVIASADSLLALPFWRARERFIRLSYLFAECADTALIGTRLVEDTAVQFVKDPQQTEFFAEEESLRRALGYPPFGTILTLSFEGSPAMLSRLHAHIEQTVSGYPIRQVPDRLVKGTTLRRTLVLMLKKDTWPDSALAKQLATLPPSIRVMVDSESFW